MLKFNRIVCALAVCACVTAVYGAGAVKIKALTPTGVNGLAENPDGDGFAILNYHAGNNETEIQIAITDFVPNTLYTVDVTSGFRNCGSLSDLETNVVGNGTLHFVCRNDFSIDPIVRISIFDGNFDEVDIITDEEIRAQGSAQ